MRRHGRSGLGLLVVILMVMFFAAGAFAEGAIDLPQTGQTTCYNAAGGAIACADTGQDGDWLAGAIWPTPRFVSGTGAEADCMIDNLTGLMWPKNGNQGYSNWHGALDIANGLSLCGHSDWRLPNVVELRSLINNEEPNNVTWLNSQGFNSVQSYYYYWSSSTLAYYTDYAWFVNMNDGFVYYYDKGYNYYVWPVRAGQSGSFGTSAVDLPRTGQTASYYTGDDGAVQAGVAWPNPRYSVNGECVTDNLTGLMWTKDANRFGFQSWQTALNSANDLSLCGFTDWRLPNVNELRSVVDYSNYGPALPDGPPFTNVQSYGYWSSSTFAGYMYYAWNVYMDYGYVSYYLKDLDYYVWPVRTGQFGNLIISPSNLTAKAVSPSKIVLGWKDNSDNETGFKLERKTGACGSANSWAELPAAIAADAVTYTNTGLTANTTYSYRLRAYNASGNSDYSNCATAITASAKPLAPTTLTATVVSESAIDLGWKDNATNETGFNLERKAGICSSTNTWAQIATPAADVITYPNTGLTASTTYSYRVRAYNASGNSAYSNCSTATTAAAGGPAITKQPQNTAVNAGQTATFSVTATGAAPLSYQWQSSDFGAEIWTDVTVGTGGKTKTYTTPATTDSDNGAKYRVLVSNSSGSATSQAATIAITSPEDQPLTTAVSDKTVTVTQAGTLKDLAFTFPQAPPAGFKVWKAPNGAPAIPAGVTRLSDFFHVSPVENAGGMITITLPIGKLPSGREAEDLRLYVYSDAAQNVGPGGSISGPNWLRTWYDLDVLPNGKAIIKLGGLGDMSFIGIEAPVAPTAASSGTSHVNTRRGPLAVSYICTPKDLLIGLPSLNQEVCIVEYATGKSIIVIVKNIGALHTTPAASTAELLGWIAAGRLALDGYGLLSDSVFEVEVGPMDKATLLGYVWSAEDYKIVHITNAANAKDWIQTTTVHEYFHHAQSRTKATGKTNLIDTNHVGDWLTEGLASWVMDEIFDSLNTYTGLNNNPLPRILEWGLGVVPVDGNISTNAYNRFAFWKMVKSKCPGFYIPDILNVDAAADPNGLVLFKSMAESETWKCDFGAGFGNANKRTLASALLYYTYATVKGNDMSLLDSNEILGNFGFDKPYAFYKFTPSAACKSWDDCPASARLYRIVGNPASAVPFLINSVPRLNPGDAVTLELESTPKGKELWVWIGDNEKPGGLTNGAWYKSAETIKHVFSPGVRAPEMMVVVVNPNPKEAVKYRVRASLSVPVPVITSLTPSSGVVGSSVTVSGTGFGATQSASTVTFNGTSAATVSSWSDTSIAVKVPTGATTGNVVVTVNGVASNGVKFSLGPVITSLNPTSGKVGDTVTITGTGFGASQSTSTVSFNGTNASVSSWSATSVVATVPAGATTGNVVVTNHVTSMTSNGVLFTVSASGDCINDPSTGLCWDIKDSATLKDWTAAGTYCSGKGTRLPTIEELVLFATEGEVQFTDQGYLYGTNTDLRPRLTARGYEYTGDASYWSSTTGADYPDGAWSVVFYGGYVDGYVDKSYDYYVRCVRAGQ